MSFPSRRLLACAALVMACAAPSRAERYLPSDACVPALEDAQLAATPAASDALPLPLLVAETPIERAVRCAAEREACYAGCAVLPQVSLCRSNCDKAYRTCMGGSTGPSPL